MIRILTGSAAAALVLASASAHAEVEAPDAILAASPSGDARGYRVDVASDGFQLVNHGVWQTQPVADIITWPTSLARVRIERQSAPPGFDRTAASSFRRASYLRHVYAAEARFALPAGLLDALIWTESRYNPLAVSEAGATGLGQLMPATARDLGVSNRFDPLQNVAGAARYLRQMLDKFGAVDLALAAYNAGPGAVRDARGIPRNGETPAYVMNVLKRWRP